MNYDYTIASTDKEHFNRIRVNLPQPPWKYSNIIITSCITNCNILILKKGDYIIYEIDGIEHKLEITTNITNISSPETFIATLSSISNYSEMPVKMRVSTDQRILLYSPKQFIIKDVSYNLKIILGLYYKIDFPLLSTPNPKESKDNPDAYIYQVQAIGYFLSTPVLYLISNLGGVNYYNHSDNTHKIDANSISMRLLNSFTQSLPIIGSNTEFSKIVLSSDLTDFELMLVDANMKEIEILNPMYITINVSNANDSMSLEDIDKYQYSRKINHEEEAARLQMLKVKYDRINKEMNEEFQERFEQ